MTAFESSVDIAAGPDAVWSVLIDGAAWPSWDSGVESVAGRIAAGEMVTVRSKVAPGRAFPVKVTGFDQPLSFVFTGGLPLGLFRGVRTYRLVPTKSGTQFFMREEYFGPLAGLMVRSIPDLGPSFRQFASGLKTRVEAGGGG